MAAFDFVALDENGRRQRGVIEADSARQVRQILRTRGITPLSVEEARQSPRKKLRDAAPMARRQLRGISLREVSQLTRQLATMVQAGLPVEQALQALSRQSEKPGVQSMLAAIRAQVLEGRTLSESLAAFPRSFSELFRASIHAGERTGHLDRVLEHLADYSESSHQARQKIMLALLYPAVLTVVSLLVIVFLLAYIVPDMIRVFTDTGNALPMLTRGLIAVSAAVQHGGVLFILAIGGAVMAAKRALRRPEYRQRVDRSLLRWPLIGRIIRQHHAARFAATLGMLQESGVPLVQGLEIAAAVMSNRHIRLAVEEVGKKVREGVSLARAMEQSGIFPPVLVTMVGSGEASGTLGPMLTRASTMQQRDLENRIAIILGLFEPFILLVMGGLVLLLVLAIIMPILNLNQLVK